MLENFPDALVRLCGALEVLLGADLLADVLGLSGVSGVLDSWEWAY